MNHSHSNPLTTTCNVPSIQNVSPNPGCKQLRHYEPPAHSREDMAITEFGGTTSEEGPGQISGS